MGALNQSSPYTTHRPDEVSMDMSVTFAMRVIAGSINFTEETVPIYTVRKNIVTSGLSPKQIGDRRFLVCNADCAYATSETSIYIKKFIY